MCIYIDLKALNMGSCACLCAREESEAEGAGRQEVLLTPSPAPGTHRGPGTGLLLHRDTGDCPAQPHIHPHQLLPALLGPISTPAAPGPARGLPAAAACLPGDHEETGDYSDPSQTSCCLI